MLCTSDSTELFSVRKREIPSKRVDGKPEAEIDADTDALASPYATPTGVPFLPFPTLLPPLFTGPDRSIP